tara:strand:- start:6459 stop:6656 length:198 start_codon:yes stop_codon:yes gene_type:complete
MPYGRIVANKASITNRGPESGGSVGGNSKAGLINFALYPAIANIQSVHNRLAGACCKDPNKPQPS